MASAPTTKKTSAKLYRPEDLAKRLGISGKLIRAFCRKAFTRPEDVKGTSWFLTTAQANEVIKHFRDRAAKGNKDSE